MSSHPGSGFGSLSNDDIDVAESEEVVSDSVEKRRSRKRKVGPLTFYGPFSYQVINLKHDDAEYPEPQEKIKTVPKLRPKSDRRVKTKTKARKRADESQRVVEATVEHGGAPNGPELHSVAKPNELHTASGDTLAPEPSMLSRSNPNTACSAGADEHAPKKASRTTTKRARKRRTSALNKSSRSTDVSQTLGEMAEGRVISEPDQVMDHTAAGVTESRDGKQSLPPFTFDNAGEEVPEDEGDHCDCTLSDYPVLGLEEEKHVSQLPKPPLPVTPPIWAQVRRIVCRKENCYMVPSLDRKCARPLTTSEAIKVASITTMILSKDIFLGPIPPGQCIH